MRRSSRFATPSSFLGRVLLLLTVACSGQDASAPEPRAPVISISGVQEGETRSGPVTITISVDVGTYDATLNGEPFISGRMVQEPKDYVLEVTARNGTAVSTATVRFTITLSGETRLIIRLFDLGPNPNGGGGDAILLTDSSGAGSRHVLVDAGPAGLAGADLGFVSRQLDALGVDTLQALILSHAHSDHFDGIPAVLQNTVVLRFVYNGQVRDFSRYNQVIVEAQQRAAEVIIPSTVTELQFGLGPSPTRLAVLSPLSMFLGSPDATSTELNDGSIGTEVRKGNFRMFLTGDGEILANQRWQTGFADRTTDLQVLKLGHHGANDATFDNGFNGNSSWLAHTQPEVTVISANGTSHPRRNALAYVQSLPEVQTYCTNVHGDIEIRVGEAGAFVISAEANGSADCVPGSDATT